MGQTKYNLNTLSEKENDIIKITKRIDYIFNRFKMIKNSIDIDITRRDNIDDHFNTLTNDFQNIIESTYNSSQIINKAVMEYSNSEHQIQNLLNQLLDTSTGSHDTDTTKTDHDEVSISGISLLQNWFERLYNQLISKITHVKKFFEDNGVHINNKDYSEHSVGQIKESADLQDADILSSSDLNNVYALKTTYAYLSSKENKDDQMLAILRAIDIIRQKDEYNGLYYSQDKDGNYKSQYYYKNSRIHSKLNIIQNDKYRMEKGFNIMNAISGILVYPIGVVSALGSIAPEAGTNLSNDITDENTPDMLNVTLNTVGLSPKPKNLGTFITFISAMKTDKELEKIKGYSSVSVSFEHEGIIETFNYVMNKNNTIVSARKQEPIKVTIPAQYSYLYERHPSPDLKINRNKMWFD
ncbi:hypothetical protein [Vallitalea guaymasensis]|uniref:Uncharacterized protein n=1 Tax=Vallitalea guaymasensis TaxID=1185412 RepID=A0A8J8SDF3_9FIRM|nr:hypothetical protein [Vallitalea guaymasensis]QUH30416.1 hypothetical protein HYG85_16480 [Vallitalea guaymasensis]